MLTTSFPKYKGHIQSPFIYMLCKTLAKKEVILDVVCPGDFPTKREETLDHIAVHRFFYFFPISFQKLTTGGGIPSNLKASLLAKLQFPFFFLSFFMRSLYYAKRCDIIHAQWSFSALVGILLKKIYHKPLLLTERGASANLAMKSKIMKPVLLYVLRHCDFVTANNVDQIISLHALGLPKEKLKTIPNGIAMDLFKPRDKQACRKKLGWDENTSIILFVGWLIKRKGVHYLLQALPKVLAKKKQIRCYIIGEGIWESRLKQLSDTLGLKHTITFLGPQLQEDLPYYLNAADVLVLPSSSEGKPNVVGEALACGTPVVASDVNGTREFFELFSYGFLVPPKNIEKLSQALLKAVNKQWDLSKHKKAFQSFRKQLTWDASADTYLKIYKSLL